MFFVGGLHRKQHHIANRFVTCPNCYRPASVSYIMVKRALHLFWIPIFPAGSTMYIKCQLCGREWKDPHEPSDSQFYGYLGIAFIFLFMGLGVAWYTCAGAIPFAILNIVVSSAYLLSAPSIPSGYPPGTTPPANAPDIYSPPAPVYPQYQAYAPQPQPTYYNPQYSPNNSPYASSVTYDRGSTLRAQQGGYYTESVCPNCHRVIGQVQPGQVVKCPFCGETAQA